MSYKVSTHPVAEAVARKLHGITSVPSREADAMAHRAASAAAEESDRQRAQLDEENERLRELVAGLDDGGHWYSQQTMDAVVAERNKLQAALDRYKESYNA